MLAIIFGFDTKRKDNKSKNIGPHQTKKNFYSAKERISKMKRQSTEWEKIFLNHLSDNRLLSKIYKEEFIKLDSEKPNNPINRWAEVLNRHFFSKDIQMTNRYVKDAQQSLIIREVQIKITMRSHLIPVRMAIIKRTQNNKCWCKCGGKGTTGPYQ